VQRGVYGSTPWCDKWKALQGWRAELKQLGFADAETAEPDPVERWTDTDMLIFNRLKSLRYKV